jgi:hypothetical protein
MRASPNRARRLRAVAATSGCVVILLTLPWPLHAADEPAKKDPPLRSDGVSFVAEMNDVQELRCLADGTRWSDEEAKLLAADVARAGDAWKARTQLLTPLVTAERVRQLSGWAKPQMQSYTKVPPLADVRLQPIGLDAGRGQLVLEGTIDTLPTHHHLVTRWLKVYVLYDLSGRKIEHVTFTIRGQILE